MEKDILNYSPTVMFRGTPCTLDSKDKGIIKLEFVTKTQFLSTLKNLRSTTLESKDIGFRKAKFVAKIQFL